MTEDKGFVYVALERSSQIENIQLAQKLSENVKSDRYGFKPNLHSIADFSSEAMTPHDYIRELKQFERRIFVDLKMWNGGRTMERIARGCADLEVDIINMYAHAGLKAMERIHGALAGSRTKLFGLTVLTHYTDEDTLSLYGKNMKDAVRMLAERCYYQADGVILPGTQLEVVQDLSIQKLCPGIRPSWFEDKKINDQEQVVTPEEAIAHGADYLVIGSPILNSDNPSFALERILKN